MYDTVLIPTDGSDESLKAAEKAIETAKTHDAELHAIHCVNISAPIMGESGSSTNQLGHLHEIGEDAIKEVERRTDDLTMQTEIINGKASRTIVEYADKHDIDLIVMGTHGRTGIDRLLIGSVTESVLRKADCPVLSVK